MMTRRGSGRLTVSSEDLSSGARLSCTCAPAQARTSRVLVRPAGMMRAMPDLGGARVSGKGASFDSTSHGPL